MGTLRPRNQGVTTSPGRPIVLHGSLSNSFLWERPTWRGPDSPPWKRSRMAHRSDSEASRLGLNLLLSNHCHWHRLVCYAACVLCSDHRASRLHSSALFFRGVVGIPTESRLVIACSICCSTPSAPNRAVRRAPNRDHARAQSLEPVTTLVSAVIPAHPCEFELNNSDYDRCGNLHRCSN